MKISQIPLLLVGVISIFWPVPVGACLVCVADPLERVLVTALQASEDVVLARTLEGDGGGGGFRISRVLKGGAGTEAGLEVEAQLPAFSADAGKVGRRAVLLTRRDRDAQWVMRAPASLLHQVLFYQKVISMQQAKSADQAQEDRRRAAFFLSYLHHADPLLVRVAAAEVSSAPYPAMKALREKLDVEKIRAELEIPASFERFALYFTLLGLCGDEGDAAGIDRRLDSMWRAKASSRLAALLTAKIELGGEAAVDEIEARYFRDQGRTLPEIEAAVLALRVHGDADDKISQARAIEAFRSLLVDREPLAFLVAEDLARWKDWESRDRLVAIAEKRGGDLVEIRTSVDAYLKACPERLSDR